MSWQSDWNPDPAVIDDLVRFYSHFPSPGRATIPFRDDRDIFPTYNQYSPLEIIQHVKKGTSLGQRFYLDFLELRKLIAKC